MSAICGTASSETTCSSCLAALEDVALKCYQCHTYTHLQCSNFSDHQLVRLLTSQVKYQCGSCIAGGLGEEIYREKLAKVKTIKEKEELCIKAAVQESEDTPDPTVHQASGQDQVVGPRNGDSRSDLRNENVDNQASRVTKNSKSICKFYKSGKCKHGVKGTGCLFEHPKKCFKFMAHGDKNTKGCKEGSNCNFYHPPMCRSSMRSGMCTKEQCKFPHIRGTKFNPRGETSRDVPLSSPTINPRSCNGRVTYAEAARPRYLSSSAVEDNGTNALQQNFDKLCSEIQQMRSFMMQLVERDRWMDKPSTPNYHGFRDLSR